MSKTGGGGIWIFGVLVFLLCLNAAYGLFELVVKGAAVNVNVLSWAGAVLDVPVLTYVVLAMSLAAVAFGFFCSVFISRVSLGTNSDEMLSSFDGKLQHNRGKLENVVTKQFAKLQMNDFKMTEDLKEIEAQLTQAQKTMEQIGKKRMEHLTAVERQNVVLKDVKKKIEAMESQLIPKPLLTSRSDIKEVSGVGEKTAEELKSVGITDVEKLIVEDPDVIARLTKFSKKTVEKIQGTAQLLMIPRMDEDKAKLLQRAGITSGEQLANQNPILLLKKVNNVAKKSDVVPALEEIVSYIRFTRSNFSVLY